MKNLFPEFKKLDEQQVKEAWENGIFIFDTNVLLNLYRYQKTTRDELIRAIKKLKNQIWIPHHVALEFHRNRLSVIADQNRKFDEVKQSVEKAKKALKTEIDNLQLTKRHALINPDPLTNGFEELTNSFLQELETLRKSQPNATDPDPLLDQIESLFEKKVGDAPSSQEELDNIYKEAKKRYENQIPPGYKDADKTSKQADGEAYFVSKGLIYKTPYGDLIVWKQVLEKLKSDKIGSLIFITDDTKEDWWQKIYDKGPKIIGPRRELIDEVSRYAGTSRFLMYTPDRFLGTAKDLIHTRVSDETLNEVRDLSFQRRKGTESVEAKSNYSAARLLRFEWLIRAWIEENFGSCEDSPFDTYDHIAITREGESIGFNINYLENQPFMSLSSLKEKILMAVSLIDKKIVDKVCFLAVTTTPELIPILSNLYSSILSDVPGDKRRYVSATIGVLNPEENSIKKAFVPHDII